jgi:cysteine synthase
MGLARFDQPAKTHAKAKPGYAMPNQYENPQNVEAHLHQRPGNLAQT